jgi:hypothetical protein
MLVGGSINKRAFYIGDCEFESYRGCRRERENGYPSELVIYN